MLSDKSRQRDAVDQHVALLRIVEPAEQVDERALAAAVRADDRHMLASLNRQVHVGKGLMRAVVAEQMLRNSTCLLIGRQCLGRRRLAETRLHVEHGVEEVRRRHPRI